MGLSYVAKFCSHLSIDQIGESLRSQFDLEPDPTHGGATPLVPAVTLLAPEFIVSVTKTSTVVGMDQIIRTNLGIKVDTSVQLLIGPGFSTTGEGGSRVAAVIDFLLRMTQGGFAFLGNYELVLLLRDDAGVSLNATAGFWNPTNRAYLTSPFTERALPIL